MFSGGVCCLDRRCERFFWQLRSSEVHNPCEGIELTGADGLTGTLLGAPERVQRVHSEQYLTFISVKSCKTDRFTCCDLRPAPVFSPSTGQPIDLCVWDVETILFQHSFLYSSCWWENWKGLQRGRGVVAKPALASAKVKKKQKKQLILFLISSSLSSGGNKLQTPETSRRQTEPTERNLIQRLESAAQNCTRLFKGSRSSSLKRKRTRLLCQCFREELLLEVDWCKDSRRVSSAPDKYGDDPFSGF